MMIRAAKKTEIRTRSPDHGLRGCLVLARSRNSSTGMTGSFRLLLLPIGLLPSPTGCFCGASTGCTKIESGTLFAGRSWLLVSGASLPGRRATNSGTFMTPPRSGDFLFEPWRSWLVVCFACAMCADLGSMQRSPPPLRLDSIVVARHNVGANVKFSRHVTARRSIGDRTGPLWSAAISGWKSEPRNESHLTPQAVTRCVAGDGGEDGAHAPAA